VREDLNIEHWRKFQDSSVQFHEKRMKRRLLEKTQDLKKQDTREDTAVSFAFSKHGAGRSMDGLGLQIPAT
jgi:hypothetical protein